MSTPAPVEHAASCPLDCPACRARSLVRNETHLAALRFGPAFEAWLSARKVGVPGREETSVRYIGEESERTYREYAWALSKFFAPLTLAEIHDGHLRVYQDRRSSNAAGLWKKPCAQNRIHKEIGLLLRLLRAADCWHDDLDEAFDQLPLLGSDVPRVLEPGQQTRLLELLAARAEWHWIHDYAVLALETCASTQELRMIRLRDINLRTMTLRIGLESSKNKFRNRTIPLESEAVVQAVMRLRHRASNFGAVEPEHFLFPFGAGSRRGDLDVTLPMTKFGLKSNWNRARKEAGVPWLRPYDLRHTAITRMAEAGVPIATIMAFAGHISPKMQQHYTTISMQAKRMAAKAAWERNSLGSQPAEKKPPASVLVRSA